LCDLDFADDIVLIDNSQRSTHQMTRATESEVNKVGLHMKSVKCKVTGTYRHPSPKLETMTRILK